MGMPFKPKQKTSTLQHLHSGNLAISNADKRRFVSSLRPLITSLSGMKSHSPSEAAMTRYSHELKIDQCRSR